MIVVYNADALKTSAETFEIDWSAKKSQQFPGESVDDYNFYILWSNSPTDGFRLLTDSSGSPVIIDGAVGPLHYIHDVRYTQTHKEHYYQIRAEKKTDPSIYRDFQVSTFLQKSDGVIDTIAYAEYILNNYYIGDPVYILKRKTDGARCPQCWNPYQYRRTKTHCSLCHGTGFFDGFYKAFPSHISFDANPKTTEMNLTGEITTTMIVARMGGFPLLSPRDMIVKKTTNQRFTITRIDYTKLPNMSDSRKCLSNYSHVISQILQLAELPTDDDKYNVLILIADIRSYLSVLKSPKSLISGSGLSMPYKKGKFASKALKVSGTGVLS